MRTNRWRRVGAALLIVGGLLEAAALGVGTVVSPPSATALGAALVAAPAGAWLLVGVGLISTGVSVTGRGRTAVRTAGVLACIVGVMEVVQFAGGTVFGPGFATYFGFIVAITVAGLRMLSDRTLRGVVRWSVAVPAVCIVLSVAGGFVPVLAPLLSLPGMIALPWVGVAVGGLLLLTSSRHPDSATATTVASTRQETRSAALKALLAAEILLLGLASLIVRYGGIPFGSGVQAAAWCIDHGGLPGGISTDEVRVDHTLWPLGITCTADAAAVPHPDWLATFWDYGLFAAVLVGVAGTLVLLVRALRRLGAGVT